MAQQTYSTKASRNLIRAEMKMLSHAEAPQVLGAFGVQEQQPLNKTDTIVFRRVKPFNSAANETASSFRRESGSDSLWCYRSAVPLLFTSC